MFMIVENKKKVSQTERLVYRLCAAQVLRGNYVERNKQTKSKDQRTCKCNPGKFKCHQIRNLLRHTIAAHGVFSMMYGFECMIEKHVQCCKKSRQKLKLIIVLSYLCFCPVGSDMLSVCITNLHLCVRWAL